jgi:hypothetical protein
MEYKIRSVPWFSRLCYRDIGLNNSNELLSIKAPINYSHETYLYKPPPKK